MIKSSISGLNKLRAELAKEMERLSPNETVMIGLNEGLGKHPNSELNIPTIGAIQQFGTATIPARPWLDTGVAKAMPQIDRIMAKEYKSDDFDPKKMLELIGVAAVNHVQKNIEEIKSPPNAASTVAQKGSSNPLIDTGTMRQSVTYVLTTEKPTEGIQ
jgi:hypothetical protein